jgi:hypothetical protein
MTALRLSIRTDEFDSTAAYKPNANGKAEEDEDESLIEDEDESLIDLIEFD